MLNTGRFVKLALPLFYSPFVLPNAVSTQTSSGNVDDCSQGFYGELFFPGIERIGHECHEQKCKETGE